MQIQKHRRLSSGAGDSLDHSSKSTDSTKAILFGGPHMDNYRSNHVAAYIAADKSEAIYRRRSKVKRALSSGSSSSRAGGGYGFPKPPTTTLPSLCASTA